MTNHEHQGESEPSQPDQPYEQVSPTTQVVTEYIAAGLLDSSTISTDNVREIDSLYVKMFNDLKSLVYEYLSEHGELPPLTGLPAELQQMAQLFEEQYRNGTPPQPPDMAPPLDTPPSPDTPQ